MRYFFTHLRKLIGLFRIRGRFCKYAVGLLYWSFRLAVRDFLKLNLLRAKHVLIYIWGFLHINYEFIYMYNRTLFVKLSTLFSLQGPAYAERFTKWFMQQPLWANFYVDLWELDQITEKHETVSYEWESVNNGVFLKDQVLDYIKLDLITDQEAKNFEHKKLVWSNFGEK